MKRSFVIFFVLSLGFFMGVFYPKYKGWISNKKKALIKEVYATHPIIKNAPIVILITARNNQASCEKTLFSILSQDYDNYRLVYIDQNSTDGSYEKVKNLCTKYTQVELICSKQDNIEALYRTIHTCNHKEIVLILQGDEFLAHDNVLQQINHYYANPDVWVTEGNAIKYPNYSHQAISKIRTFYASLFHRIKLQDFLIDGTFSADNEIFHSLLKQISGKHVFLTPDTLYISGITHTPYKIEKEVTYRPFCGIPTDDFIHAHEHVDIVVFSYNRPLQLYAFLESQKTHIKNLHQIYVIYRAENDHYEEGYCEVKKDYPGVIYINQTVDNSYKDFAPVLMKTAFNKQMSTARYVAFALDDNIVRDSIDMEEVVTMMKKTGAYGFYFSLGTHIENSPDKIIPIKGKTHAWQFSNGKKEWACPNSVNMTLFKKEDIYPYFQTIKFFNPNILQSLWNEHADLSKIGLYYDQSKVINLSFNNILVNESINESENTVKISTKELLSFFDQGLKIDIRPFKKLENNKVEVSYEVQFIKR